MFGGVKTVGGGRPERKKDPEGRLHSAFANSSRRTTEAIFSLQHTHSVWAIQCPTPESPRRLFPGWKMTGRPPKALGRHVSHGAPAVRRRQPGPSLPARPSAGRENATSCPRLLGNVLGTTEPSASDCLPRELARSHGV